MAWIAVPVLLFTVGMALAQLPTATILGTVKDASGAVVPGASLTTRNMETGLTRATVASADGSYRFSALPVGNYEVRVEQSGFQTAIRSGLTLTVGQEAVINLTLEVGAVTQTVAVTAEAPLVETTSGSMGGLVDQQRMSELPLNGRNFVDLALLQTGVVRADNTEQRGGATGMMYSVMGAPVRSNNYLLDGASMVSLYGISMASIVDTTLGMDGIQEYKVVTNMASAEYGMSMGSQMMLVSKGGTNAFHGTAFEYLRNSALDARNFFDRITPTTARRLPNFVRNQFGASLGGPIRRNRTFFHGVYEGLRQSLGITRVINVIPPSAKVDGDLVPVIDPVMKPFLQFFPDPNLPNNQFIHNPTQTVSQNYEQVRVDHMFSENDSLFARYTIDKANKFQPLEYPAFHETQESLTQFATLSLSHIFTPTLLSTARFSFSRTNLEYVAPGPDSPELSLGVIPGAGMTSISIPGVTSMGPSGRPNDIMRQNIFTWSDDMFYTRSRHSLKFGFLLNRFQQYGQLSLGNRGGLPFDSLTDFLRNNVRSISVNTPGSINDRTYFFSTFGFYLQDDIRVKSNFTLNLGLRYEFHTVNPEQRGRAAALVDAKNDAKTTLGVPPHTNPSLKNFSPRFGFAWDVRGDGKTAVRGGFGLLYDINSLAAARYVGASAMPPFSSRSLVNNVGRVTFPYVVPPGFEGNVVRGPDYNMSQPHMLQYNLTVERELPGEMALMLAYGGSRGINLIQSVEANPRTPRGVPVGRGTGTGVCQTSSTPVAFNPTGPRCWTGQESPDNPNWETVQYIATAAGDSFYNSFQFGLRKRLSRGLQFQSSYTWSKSIDHRNNQTQQEGSFSADQYSTTDPQDQKYDRGLSGFDVRHNWRFNTIYRLPDVVSSGGAAGKLLNGWWLSGIVSARTGLPVTPTVSRNRSCSGGCVSPANLDRPDWAGGRSFQDIIQGGSEQYFDPRAFVLQPRGFLGSAGRGIITGPGSATLDLSASKDTALGFLGESGALQFRAEFFNLLNRVNFGLPGRTIFSGVRDGEAPLSTAGRIQTTNGTSRQIQFALRLVF
ncbi:MAG: hypothetical protein A3F68_05095 [Acidobacteria bacterium RIFCSPLOWO2_12_FULL_54_10]|nr:MAG: hypothetical protein A3F68_05095 [Acidobacteria bacterium RIFCSPLOWO2_12_FULL_54_10]